MVAASLTDACPDGRNDGPNGGKLALSNITAAPSCGYLPSGYDLAGSN